MTEQLRYYIVLNGKEECAFRYDDWAQQYLDIICGDLEKGNTISLHDRDTGECLIAYDEAGEQIAAEADDLQDCQEGLTGGNA